MVWCWRRCRRWRVPTGGSASSAKAPDSEEHSRRFQLLNGRPQAGCSEHSHGPTLRAWSDAASLRQHSYAGRLRCHDLYANRRADRMTPTDGRPRRRRRTELRSGQRGMIDVASILQEAMRQRVSLPSIGPAGMPWRPLGLLAPAEAGRAAARPWGPQYSSGTIISAGTGWRM